MENRFYLDLNRNGFFDTNGAVVDAGGTETNLEVGDPEWVGILQHPDQPYGPNNPFVARYAFIAVPIGNGLDLNCHLQRGDGESSKMRAMTFRQTTMLSCAIKVSAPGKSTWRRSSRI